MTKNNEKITQAMTDIYQTVEDTVVGSYKKVEDTVVGGYTKLESAFVGKFLTKDGETVEQAKERLKKQTEA